MKFVLKVVLQESSGGKQFYTFGALICWENSRPIYWLIFIVHKEVWSYSGQRKGREVSKNIMIDPLETMKTTADFLETQPIDNLSWTKVVGGSFDLMVAVEKRLESHHCYA